MNFDGETFSTIPARDNEIDALKEKLASADARIAELDLAVTVRDTEIARLETDLELARRDAHLRHGYAPGDYSCVCGSCNRLFVGDKRAFTCKKCADKAISAARAGNG